VWAALVILTGVSWALNHAIGESARLVETGAILTIALVKVRLVGLDFMDLRNAPRSLRLIFEGYVIALWIMLLALCLAA
jgi:Prokaryotic Cytochrome C oxidase subunit IV